MARPKVQIDERQLRAIMRMKPTLADVAAFFSCSVDTIERHIQNEFGVNFSEFRDQNLVQTRFDLYRKATEMALAGNVSMLTLCLKHYCGWTDKAQAEDGGGERIVRLAYSLSGPDDGPARTG